MKKVFLLVAVILTGFITVNAQGVNGTRNAIGIRAGWGADISYQRYVSYDNRIEATLGFNRYGVDVTGIYQWMFDINSAEAGQFKWYVGPGLELGGWTSNKYKNGFSMGILGQIGIEYGFAKIPLLLSLDYRPGLYFAPKVNFNWTGFALGVRYCF